jgi:hypothetical protein
MSDRFHRYCRIEERVHERDTCIVLSWYSVVVINVGGIDFCSRSLSIPWVLNLIKSAVIFILRFLIDSRAVDL